MRVNLGGRIGKSLINQAQADNYFFKKKSIFVRLLNFFDELIYVYRWAYIVLRFLLIEIIGYIVVTDDHIIHSLQLLS